MARRASRGYAKATVEKFRFLDAHEMVRDHGLRSGVKMTIRWMDEATGEVWAMVKCSVRGGDVDEGRLDLALWSDAPDGSNVETEVTIEATYPHIGGRRWWFICPDCGVRRTRLYRRQGLLLCRVCHGLTYQSCQRAHYAERASRREDRERWKTEQFLLQMAEQGWMRPNGEYGWFWTRPCDSLGPTG